MNNKEDILIFTDSIATSVTTDTTVDVSSIVNTTGYDPDWADIDIDSITLDISGDRTIEGVNKRLDAIEARLNILTPDPEMLENYELLQSLYEQYKTAEALLKNNNTLE
jgi:hypothetical protein